MKIDTILEYAQSHGYDKARADYIGGMDKQRKLSVMSEGNDKDLKTVLELFESPLYQILFKKGRFSHNGQGISVFLEELEQILSKKETAPLRINLAEKILVKAKEVKFLDDVCLFAKPKEFEKILSLAKEIDSEVFVDLEKGKTKALIDMLSSPTEDRIKKFVNQLEAGSDDRVFSLFEDITNKDLGESIDAELVGNIVFEVFNRLYPNKSAIRKFASHVSTIYYMESNSVFKQAWDKFGFKIYYRFCLDEPVLFEKVFWEVLSEESDKYQATLKAYQDKYTRWVDSSDYLIEGLNLKGLAEEGNGQEIIDRLKERPWLAKTVVEKQSGDQHTTLEIMLAKFKESKELATNDEQRAEVSRSFDAFVRCVLVRYEPKKVMSALLAVSIDFQAQIDTILEDCFPDSGYKNEYKRSCHKHRIKTLLQLIETRFDKKEWDKVIDKDPSLLLDERDNVLLKVIEKRDTHKINYVLETIKESGIEVSDAIKDKAINDFSVDSVDSLAVLEKVYNTLHPNDQENCKQLCDQHRIKMLLQLVEKESKDVVDKNFDKNAWDKVIGQNARLLIDEKTNVFLRAIGKGQIRTVDYILDMLRVCEVSISDQLKKQAIHLSFQISSWATAPATRLQDAIKLKRRKGGIIKTKGSLPYLMLYLESLFFYMTLSLIRAWAVYQEKQLVVKYTLKLKDLSVDFEYHPEKSIIKIGGKENNCLWLNRYEGYVKEVVSADLKEGGMNMEAALRNADVDYTRTWDFARVGVMVK